MRTLFLLLGLLFACPIMGHAGVTITNLGGGSSTPAQIITTATTYYVCAKAASGTCVYNGDAGTVATPSDSNDCVTKALPCTTIAGVATKLSGYSLAALVTIQLADTAGTGTDCYRPNNTIFNTSSLTGTFDTALEAGESGANTYPSAYLYLVGNTTTPSNVIITGATTCVGTVGNVESGIRFSNITLRLRGVKAQYWQQGTVPDSGMFLFSRSSVFAEDIYCTGDGAATGIAGWLLYGFDHTVLRLGSSLQWTVTNCGIFDIANLSHGSFITPLGRANLAITTSGTWSNTALFISNESSHIGIDGLSLTVTGNSSSIVRVWYSMAGSKITWNDNATFTAPAWTHTYNGTLTLDVAQQGSYIRDGCRTMGQLICNIGATTTVSNRAQADTWSFIHYDTRGTITNADTTVNFSVIDAPNTHQFGWNATLQANLGTPANGTMIYCSDCTIANPCAGGGTGAMAKRLNNVWVCN